MLNMYGLCGQMKNYNMTTKFCIYTRTVNWNFTIWHYLTNIHVYLSIESFFFKMWSQNCNGVGKQIYITRATVWAYKLDKLQVFF